MINGTIHCVTLFMLHGYTSTLDSLTRLVLDLMLRLWMDYFPICRGWYQVSKNVHRFLREWKHIGWPLEHLTLTWLFRT
jgi:hypothetical protein